MRSRPLLLALVVAAALAGAFLGLLLRPSGDSATLQVQGHRVTLVPAARRKKLPDLAGPALLPPPARLKLRAEGKPAFIDVWASWCVPCREEAPILARLWRRYRSKVRFIGIDVQDTRGDARAFVRRHRLGYPSIFDSQGALAGKLDFFGLPTAYLIDGDDRIAGKLVGKQEAATLGSALADLARIATASR